MNPAMLGVLRGSTAVVDTVIAATEDPASYVLKTNNVSCLKMCINSPSWVKLLFT